MRGQTTYACRPSSRWRHRRVYASELRSSVTQAVITGLRSAGGSVSSLTSRSPYTVRASVRGMGVAVRCSTCGLLPSTSAVRCATPNLCCSSTTATARSRKSTSFSMSACVPTTISASPDVMSWRTRPCSRARKELVSRTARMPSGAQSSSIVRKCCSASVSVGAMSAP
jgi:hypothetical protein